MEKANRILSILSNLQASDSAVSAVSEDDYAFLTETGILKTTDVEGNKGRPKAVVQVVWLENSEIKNQLLAVGGRLKEKHWAALEAMKKPFVKAVLTETPKHLHKMKKFELQYIFFADGWFILHCMKGTGASW